MPEILDRENKKTIIPSGMTSREWSAVSASIRTVSDFSACVENGNLLNRLSALFRATMGEPLNGKAPRTKAEFVSMAQEWMRAEGLLDHMPTPKDSTEKERTTWQNKVTNMGSRSRLSLIFEIKMKAAHALARWEKGMTPDMLRAYPALEFLRQPGARTKRLVHVANEGSVRLKTDFDFWAMQMNSRSLGGFEVPWAPYGYNSYMDTFAVSKAEATKLGIYNPERPPALPDTSIYGSSISQKIKHGTQASIKKLSPELRAKIKAAITQKTGVEPIEKDGIIKLGKADQTSTKTSAKPEDNSKKISSHFDLSRVKDKDMKAIKDTLEAIDSVHDDGVLNSIPITTSVTDRYLGAFGYVASGRSRDNIDINTNGDRKMMTVAHEIGHFIDLRGLPDDDFHSKNMKEFLSCARKTDTIKNIKNNCMPAYARYANQAQEIFARAYAQFIATRSGNKTMLKELKVEQLRKIPVQWTDDEFKEIDTILENLIKKQQWKIKT